MTANVRRCPCCGADMEPLSGGILLLRQNRLPRAELSARELEVDALRCTDCGFLAFFDRKFVPKKSD